MNVHKNARLTPVGRALLASRVEAGWRVKAAAEASGVSVRTAYKWLGRHRRGGERRPHPRRPPPPPPPPRPPPPHVRAARLRIGSPKSSGSGGSG